MADPVGVDPRRMRVNADQVDQMERLVNNNILLTFLLREVVDHAGLQKGVPNVQVGNSVYPMHPAVVREYRDWMRDMQNALIGQLIMYGGFLVRFEPVDTPDASKEAMQALHAAMADLVAGMADVTGDSRKRRREVRDDVVAALKMEETGIAPEKRPVIVPLSQVQLSYIMDKGKPTKFEARWRETSDLSKIVDLTHPTKDLEDIMYFCMDGSINPDGTFNSHATKALYRVQAIEALLYQYARIVNGRARPVALTMQPHAMKTVNGGNMYDDWTRYGINNSGSADAQMQRIEEDARRVAANDTISAMIARDREYIEREKARIASDPAVNPILRDNPNALLHNYESTGGRRIHTLAQGDTIGQMPMPEAVGDLVEMLRMLMNDVAMGFGSRLSQIMGGERTANVTAESVRHDRESFRHHVRMRASAGIGDARALTPHRACVRRRPAGQLDPAVLRAGARGRARPRLREPLGIAGQGDRAGHRPQDPEGQRAGHAQGDEPLGAG